MFSLLSDAFKDTQEKGSASQFDGPTRVLSWFLNIFHSASPWGESDEVGAVLYIRCDLLNM